MDVVGIQDGHRTTLVSTLVVAIKLHVLLTHRFIVQESLVLSQDNIQSMNIQIVHKNAMVAVRYFESVNVSSFNDLCLDCWQVTRAE